MLQTKRDGVEKSVMLAVKFLNPAGGHIWPINLGCDNLVHILLERPHKKIGKSRKRFT